MAALYSKVHLLSFGSIFGFGLQSAQGKAAAQTDRRQIQVKHLNQPGDQATRKHTAHNRQSVTLQLQKVDPRLLHKKLLPHLLQITKTARRRLQHRPD